MNEVGERLKEARQAKGYTLDDLQQITKIQKRYLVAIEEGKLDVLPGNFYARAFIKQYADTVGLNGDQLLSEYTDFIPSPQDKNYAEKVAQRQTRSGNKKEGRLDDLQKNLPTILVILLVLAIVGAIYFAITRTNNNEQSLINPDNQDPQVEVTTNAPQEDTTEEETDSEADTSEEDTTEEEEEETSPEQSIEVVESTGTQTTYSVDASGMEEQTVRLEASGGQTWVSVTADGTTLDQGLVENGDSLEVALPEDVQEVVLVIGNAAATIIYLNEEEVPYADEANEAVRQEITFQFNQQQQEQEDEE